MPVSAPAHPNDRHAGHLFRVFPLNSLAAGLLCVFTIELTPIPAAAQGRTHTPHMSYLENHLIRIGVDLNLGGAITYLSRKGAERELNVINSFDWGRQVQLSFYSGPVPFRPPGSRLAKEWEGLGWNPIQSGDCYGHQSRVLEHHNNGRELYVKCVPMHWPLDNVPGECTFEVRLQLDGPAVKAQCRLKNQRPDFTQYRARHQELPAVYVNGPFYRLMTYCGDKPFSGDTLTRIEKTPGDTAPWARWIATENWAAHVNDEGWGVGVWNPGAFEFDGGFAGKPGSGGPADDPTGYIGPLRIEVLDHNIAYNYSYALVLGTLEQIRSYVYAHSKSPRAPRFRFKADRQGWWFENGRDSGWPLKGELRVEYGKQPLQLISPLFFYPAKDAPVVQIEAAFDSLQTNKEATVFWRRLDQKHFMPEQRCAFPAICDGKFHRYAIRVAESPGYQGIITQLRFDPTVGPETGKNVRLKSISLGK